MKIFHLAARLFFVSIIALPGCSHCRNSKDQIRSDSADWQSIGEPFGEPLTEVVCGISLGILVANPAEHYGETFLVRDATVESVSKKNGSWFLVRDGRWFVVRGGGRPVRVTFKDPGYAVPTDCEGRSAMLQGVFGARTVPEAEAKQYLEDAGRHDDAVKLVGEQRELTFIATGVRLSR